MIPTPWMSAGSKRGGVGIQGATTLLSIYLILLFLIPSRLVIGPLGSAGAPAALFGVFLAIWSLLSLTSRQSRAPLVVRPVRRGAVIFAAAVLASSVMGMLRPMNGIESTTNQVGIIMCVSWLGVLLLAHDGIRDRVTLMIVFRRLTVIGGATAVLGILQFATGRAFTDLIQIPGLEPNVTLVSVFDRSGFARPSGTAIHPIEFGTTMVILFPIALYVAFHATERLGPLGRWWPVVATGLAIPLSLSRSAFVGLVVALVVMVPTWEARRRAAAAITLVVAVAGLFVTVPGFLGTVTKLFTTAGSDSSVLSRSGSYELALEFAARSPIFGRGFLTFLPEYRILDNQYLGMLIDTGIVGVGALAALFLTGVHSGLRVRQIATRGVHRALGVAMVASVGAAGLSFAFFDALSFPQMAGTTFLVLGLVGCALRLCDDDVVPNIKPVIGERTSHSR